ncbi:PREDICTED: UDP-glycosyltransferase 92A1 [Nelumbo nucifera]|uniref:Glycosyltransferase n=2 Tax=Nelumbo nucifera TaxID=4432 RepID=A0A1U8A693_NELNU|nr:PREDICTED: UDP-glycosyltransferase 92A1 [Nelumbo nucifera]DAD42254.1 TPA_asm: hypothetical protein HUJ06_000484 [Nelumbo nucifera]
MTERENNVVLFPFMAQGHLIPFLALAHRIQERTGYTVTYVNTPLNIKKLRSSLPSNTTIRFAELPFCSADHGLPPDSENTDVLPYPLIVRLLEASLSLKPSFKRLLSDITHQQNGRPPLFIIADMFFGWSAEVADDLGIFHSVFNAGGAYGMAIYFSMWSHLPHCQTDSPEFLLPDFPEVSVIHRTQLPNNIKYANGTDAWSRFIQTQVRLWLRSDGLLFNTVEDFDRTGLQYFRRVSGRPVWAIGPTASSLTNKTRTDKAAGTTPNQCIEWLDMQPPDSVLYVCFGSQNTISASQMTELAIALEASGRNFIWVVRPPVGFDTNSEFRADDWLPEGFEKRIKAQNRGLLVRKWAPQVDILSHRSTSAFLSHCGWNSVTESLSHGVPIIGWPIAADQFYNTKFLEEEVGVCVEVSRGNECEVRSEHIRSVIESVMGSETKGAEMRRKARVVKELIKDAIRYEEGYKGSSVKALDEFIAMAHAAKKTKKELSNGSSV